MKQETINTFKIVSQAYKTVLESLPDDFYGAKYTILHNNMGSGICLYMIANNIKPICRKDMKEFTKGRGYLCNTPNLALCIPDMKEVIQIRIDRMDYFISISEKSWFNRVIKDFLIIFKSK